MEEKDQDKPIPKPRRIILDTGKCQYENVPTDAIKKKIEIKKENIHTNSNHKVLQEKELIGTEFERKSRNLSTKVDDDNFEKNSNFVKPVPAPRQTLSNGHKTELYENTIIREGSSLSEKTISKDIAIIRKAPEIPKRKSAEIHDSIRQRSVSLGDSNEVDFKLKKTVSNSTIDSFISSTSSNDNQKYKSPSPSDLLKTLGTTSRLLSEAITERVAVRAKGAKHKIDKNIKNSQNLLLNWGTETTNRLKSVREKVTTLGINNFSLSRQSHQDKVPEEDRPKTVPASDEVFQSISFNSPLNKINNVIDLSKLESSYETPKAIKLTYSPCPSYDEENKNKSDTNLREVIESESKTLGEDYELNIDYENLAMPNYPPPVLQEDVLYGKTKPIQPPLRSKRKKNYESIEFRKNFNSASSNRATIDPLELCQESESSRNSLTEEQNMINEDEKLIQTPERSKSWTYYEGNEDDSSSPEPVYANQEIMYGNLCDMDSKDNDILLTSQAKILLNSPFALTSKSEEECISADILHEFDPLMGRNLSEYTTEKSNHLLLLEHLLEKDTYGKILKGNDNTLDNQSFSSSDEENGNVAASLPIPPQRSDSLQHNMEEKQVDIQVAHQTSKSIKDDIKTVNVVDKVIFQKYLAKIDENFPNICEEENVSRPSQSRTNWFVSENSADRSKQTNLSNINPNTSTDKGRKNPFSNEKNLQDPPSYTEVMSGVTNSFVYSEVAMSSINSTNGNEQKTSVKSMFSNVLNKMDALKRKTSFRSSRPSETRIILEMVPKPTLSQRLVRYEGPLIKFPSGVVEDILKEMQNRKAVLRDRKFQTFQDQEMRNQKECFPLEYITTIQCVSNNKITDNSTHLYCFEISTALPKNQTFQQALSNPNVVITNNNSGNCKLQRICHLYGVGKESERDIWMQKLIESLTNVFPTNYTCQYYRAGWCYLKNSITSQWSGTWILLKKRKRRLIFHSDAGMNLEKMDLRKARCIVLKESDDSIKNLHVEAGPIIMIDCPPYTVYLIMNSPRETKIWRHIIREVAHNNGPLLSEQQLTKFNVPVIVDKCINFVYIHGSMSEGIYRKSGSENSIQKLLSLFRTDAFNVEITRNEYNEHDVANTLKRFMRDLPQRVLGKHSASFICVTELKSVNERISCYKDLLGRLSDVEYQTLKKLIGHLAFIHSQRDKNKMGVDNLAVIWGPTLLQSADDDMTYFQKEADVIAQLITMYKNLFPLTADEISKEQEMLQCLRKYYAAAENLSDSIKKSGDLKVWITVDSSPENKFEEKNQINVTLTPTKTAYEVCKELAHKIKVPVHQLTLHEVILNESLNRPLHHSEKVFDIVLQWSYWPEADRKNNHLVLRPLNILKEVQRALKNLATVTPGKELKFADNKTKSFKSLHVELRDGHILITKKEKNAPVLIKDICLQNVTAYLGCEKKRDFHWGWAITLIEKDIKTILRSRDLPYVGHIIAGNMWEDRIIWFSSIWNSLHGDDIIPPPEIIIK